MIIGGSIDEFFFAFLFVLLPFYLLAAFIS